MLIICDYHTSNIEVIRDIYINGIAVYINYAIGEPVTHFFNTEAEAREAYTRIVDALRDGDQLIDLRRKTIC